jgi:hypothetical protein
VDAAPNSKTHGGPPADKWSMALGHANFTIDPEPYIPEALDLHAWDALTCDREAAHAEYYRHQARTLEHYGRNSKIYRLTEDKWAEIDGQWASALKTVRAELIARGTKAVHLDTAGMSHAMRMPALNPHIDGKFPKLGDEDIVGPMMQSPPLQQPAHSVSSSNRSGSTTKLFGGKLSGIFGKGTDGR